MYTWSLSCVQLFAAPWTVAAHQAPLSMEFSRQEYWNGLPFPAPGDYPSSGVEPTSLASLALASGFCTSVPLGKPSTSLWRLVTAVPSGRAKCDRVTLTDSQIQDLRMKNSTP